MLALYIPLLSWYAWRTQIVASWDAHKDGTRLKRSTLEMHRMTEQDDFPADCSSIFPKIPTVHNAPLKQTFRQRKSQAADMPVNAHPVTKTSAAFKTHYVPVFSSFRGYQRSIRAKQEREMKEACKGKQSQAAEKGHKVLTCR